MLTDMHGVVLVAILQHTLCDGCWRMFAVGEHTYFPSPLDECPVELGPGTARERHDAHVVIGHHEAVSQQLERVERRKDHHLGIRHLPANGVGKAEEKGIARGEDDDGK